MAKRTKKRFRIKTADLFELPPETVVGGVVLRIFDNTGCTVEGAYTIGGYSETSLVLKTKFGLINFDGTAIKIERMSLEMLSFTGEIHKIEYLGFQVPQRTAGG